MNLTPQVEINRYPFSSQALSEIGANAFATGNWPLVYILSSQRARRAYIGETTNTLQRLNSHLKHSDKKTLTTVHLISSDYFNKSATLDIESELIKYLAADGQFQLLNANLGLADHNYYQRNELYSPIFRSVWDKLRAQGVARQSLESINNSDVFKYSPYKTLSFDQRQGLVEIMRALLQPKMKNLVVEGGAGTGKSVLAIFFFKLMHTDPEALNLLEFSDDENEVRYLLEQLRKRYPKPRMALVVPMTSFRTTLQKALRNVVGLRSNMVISPSQLSRQRYDIVLVDESHRLRKRQNLGAYYGAFDRACEALGLDKHTSTEIDWVQKQADKAIFFYDSAQSIKPSDANTADFTTLKSSSRTKTIELRSQFRVQGGQAYVQFVDHLLNLKLKKGDAFKAKDYELTVFDDLAELVAEIKHKNSQHGLARLVAGFAWPWKSKDEPGYYDIEIGDVRLRWNTTVSDWINTPGAENEVGCIHTTQGYDLNYTGIIFGPEITYDPDKQQIIINADRYHDRLGKQAITDPDELKQYILNIYKTMMLRGIKGTFLYACDPNLREYFKQHITVFSSKPATIQIKPSPTLKPYVNAVPYYDLKAAAGQFSETQTVSHERWVAIPEEIPIGKNLFACQVLGESMNKIIPDGAVCLFRFNPGGSRNGKIVLVECFDIHNTNDGARYTLKEYQSIKISDEDGWQHKKILLKPRSYNPSIKSIELSNTNQQQYRVVAEFVCVLEMS